MLFHPTDQVNKVSMFFKNLHSAEINSNMFSLIATCEANGVNSFAYLNWIQHNWQDVQSSPCKYLPWNFKNIKVVDNDKICVNHQLKEVVLNKIMV